MKSKEKAEIREALQAKKQELEGVIIEEQSQLKAQLDTGDSEDANVDYNHPADMLQGDPDHEKNIKLIERQRAELAMVMNALTRVEHDDFGTCEECGNDILLARLKAVPFAKYCVECQEKVEDTMTSGPSETTPHSRLSARRGKRSPDDARGGHLRSPA